MPAEAVVHNTLKIWDSRFQGFDLVAIDEAQQIPGIGMGLKILVDHLPDLRIIATGSSSFDEKDPFRPGGHFAPVGRRDRPGKSGPVAGIQAVMKGELGHCRTSLRIRSSR
jgi:hypothetical protein